MATYKRVVLTETAKDYSTQTVAAEVAKPVETFDNTYTSKKLHELYKEYDASGVEQVVQSANPTKAVVKSKEQMMRTYLFMGVAVSVSVLLLFLAIYNVFVINSYNGSIYSLQQEVSDMQSNYIPSNPLYGMSSDDVADYIQNQLGGDMGSSSDNYTIEGMDTISLNSNSTSYSSSNWFDAFVSFISGIFGG